MTGAKAWTNPLRDPRDKRLPADRGPVRPGDLRGHRGPVPQEADARHLRPGQPRAAAAGLRAHRLRPARLVHRGLRPDRLQRGEGARPHTVPADGVGPARRGLPLRAGQLRRRRRVRPPRAHRRRPRPGPRHRRQPRLLPLDPARRVPRGVQAARPLRPVRAERPPVATGRHREAVRARPRRRRSSSTASSTTSSPRTRCSASTTTSARRRCRTSWRCASPTSCSSRSGTRTTSTTCRSRWPRTSASAGARATTTASARPAT